MQEQ
jgi:diketogulonate reductase-like aldo/keto reductase